MRKYLQISLILIVILLIFNSCYKKDDYPIVPKIELLDYKRVNLGQGADSFYFSISYLDGDGDLGVGQPSTPPDSNTENYLNFYLDYYEKSGNEFRRVKPPLTNLDTISWTYRIPVLNASEKQRTIKGDINLGILHTTPPVYSNTFKFKIYITDRALHKSNVIETSEMRR